MGGGGGGGDREDNTQGASFVFRGLEEEEGERRKDRERRLDSLFFRERRSEKFGVH